MILGPWFGRREKGGAPPDRPAAAAGHPFKLVPSELRRMRDREPRRVAVVVPVYNAFDATRACLESLLAHTTPPYELIVIDDASPDERVWPTLEAIAASHGHVTLARNKTNCGFTRTANLGCELAEGDVVLLNSDTLVPPRWLERLAACAYSRPDVATATPVSNAAGAFSVPQNLADNGIPDGFTVATWADRIARLSPRLRPEVPTGHGFCLYITRRALKKIGPFDEAAFPMGYGEENDFCLRAQAKGMVNLVDDASFVYHAGSRSFGNERRDRLAREAKAKLVERYPDYNARVRAWLQADPVDRLREALRAGREPPPAPPAVLHVVLPAKGGTRYVLEDLAAGLDGRFTSLLLEAAPSHWTLSRAGRDGTVPLERWQFEDAWAFHLPMPPGRTEIFRRLLAAHDVRVAHFQHFIGTGPEAVDAAADLGVPCVATLHDFYTLCPTTQLLDETHRFCGGTCTPGDGWCELRGGWFRVAHPRLKHAYVGVHRAAMGRALARCAKVTAPSPSAAALVREHFPALPVEVVEYGRDLAREDVAAEPLPGERARVVFFSDLGVAKGIGAVRELLRIDREQGPRFQFHLFGGRSRDLGDLAALGGIYHGPFTRDELAPKLREIRPAFSIIPSIWPETYCFTLSESWALGLPVFASALGATGDRVRAAGGGWTADPSDPAAWYGMMLHALETPGEWGRRRAEALAATFRPVRAMADDYARIYAGLIA